MREVFVFLKKQEELFGLTRDISAEGASIFIKLAESLEDRSASIFYDYKLELINKIIHISVKPWDSLELFPFKITHVDLSWQKGYDIFISGQFMPMQESLLQKLSVFCPTPQTRESPIENYKSQKLELFKQSFDQSHSESISIAIQSTYANVCATRDYIASISARHHFSDESTYYIKLMADELLMNAFLYGTPKNKIPTTEVHLQISHDGLLFEISDFAGRPFNDTPYRKNNLKGSPGGLALIHALSEDWQVETDLGVSTKISFFIKK